MISLSSVLIGLGMAAAGIVFVKYGYQIRNFTGSQDWLENVTGPGTTTGIYKIFGLILVVLGLLAATGFGNNVMSFLLAPFRGLFGSFGGK